ncbi:ThuA domain-containing protein [Luteolibacter arcticus]|uniref:ThuA domain-containing protein n=1 Tax=Luteolibacter arcticus TaxID=1581411 RepID=UPI0022216550|nr:ThuA domain-containing protein [Luteolibacter arcticus]
MKKQLIALILVLASVLLPTPVRAHGIDVLVFSKTTGFRHTSIPAGVTALTELGAAHHFGVTFTENSAEFISQLPNHQVVVFLNTTGDVLDASQEAAFKTWYQNGRGFVGIHAACDAETGWPWFMDMIGAKFSGHPAIQTAEVKFLDRVHPITNVIDPATGQRIERWSRSDEWYNFTASPRGKAHVLAVLSESTYTGGAHGDDHPIAWCRDFDGGRSAYLGMGHTDETYSNAIFGGLLTNAIEWAGGEIPADSDARFTRTTKRSCSIAMFLPPCRWTSTRMAISTSSNAGAR